MIGFEGMLLRFLIALVLGALIGFERELIGKEAGIRTGMLISGGASLFTLIALALPHAITSSPEQAQLLLSANSGYLGLISNIVVGAGFLGAGIIIKQESHVFGLTTAAVIWATAGVGILSGMGLVEFAACASVILFGLLYALRNVRIPVKQEAEEVVRETR